MSSANAVINGKSANEERFEAVGALRIGPKVEVACTATLITPNWIVTAAHCVHATEDSGEEGGGEELPAEQYEFRLGNDFKKPTFASRIKRWVEGPQFEGDLLDIAFGELLNPIKEVAPVPVLSQAWDESDLNDTYFHIGYGTIEVFSNRRFPLSDKRQKAVLTVTASSGNALLKLFGTADKLERYINRYHPQSIEAGSLDAILAGAELPALRYVHAWDARGRTDTAKIEVPKGGWQDTCWGDSGGPLLREIGGALGIVGVVSHGMDRICSPMGTRFTVFGPEVRELMNQLGIQNH